MHGMRAVDREQDRYSDSHGARRMEEQPESIALAALRDDNDSEIAQIIRDAAAVIRQLVAEANDVGVIVLERRIAAAEPVTLAEIGRWVGRTGERIRGIESRLRSQIEEALRPFLAQVIAPLRDWLGDFVGDERLRRAIAALTGGTDDLAGRIISRRLMVELGYQEDGGIWASRRAVDTADRLAAQARNFSDEFGCVDEAQLRETVSGECWGDSWDELLLVAGLTRSCGVLVLAATRRAQIAAALRSIGRPATKAEIEDRLRPEVEGRMFRVDAALAAMEGVVRASKTTWGFEDWVDDVYEGIPAEIRQRIVEDGGSTRLNRLLEELPRKFGVKQASVRAYLETPAFRIEHGWVTVASRPDIEIGNLDDVISGRNEMGEPYWDFAIEERHLRGYSLGWVPPEIAQALECGFNQKSSARIRSPQGVQDISVIWRDTSQHGPEIGRLGPALREIDARRGEMLRLVIHSASEVSFQVARVAGALHTGPRNSIDAGGRRVRSNRQRHFSGVSVGSAIVATIERSSAPHSRVPSSGLASDTDEGR